MKNKIEQWIRPEIRALSAYHVPEPADVIKLDAMENPYRWPQGMVDEWLELLRDVPLNRYPDAGARAVKNALRASMQVPEGQDIMLGNGSDELIQMVCMAIADSQRSVLAPLPSFVMYHMIAQFTGMRFEGVPLRATDFSLDMPAMRVAIEKTQPAVIFLAYPNNPTGNLWARNDVEEILELAPGLVIVDEAYAPFAADSFMSDLGRFDNLLVMRTLSKFGLAGLRLGVLAGPTSWLEEIDKLRLPYNINVLTQVSATCALQHAAVFTGQASAIRAQRQLMFDQLLGMQDITPFASDANFILFRTASGRATEIFNRIREQGVLIKNLDAPGLLADCLRVTIGLPEENACFIEALRNAR